MRYMLKETKSDLVVDILIYLMAFLLAIALGAFLIWFLLKINPFSALSIIVSSSLFTPIGLSSTFEYLVPLTLISLGLAISYRAKYWNIGADGQLIFGAIFTMQAIFSVKNYVIWPGLAILFVLIMGILGGALYGLIPAVLKAKLNVNEVLSTLMLNFIAIYFMTWLVDVTGPWKDPYAAELESYPIPYKFYLENPLILLSIIIISIFLIYLLAEKTPFGRYLKILGSSKNTADYIGLNKTLTYIYLGLISGALSGLAGALQILSISHILSSDFDSIYLGYLSIFSTWLSALNPLYVVFSSLLMSVLITGGYFMAGIAGVSQLFIYYFEGVTFVSIIVFQALKHRFKKVIKNE